jgi:hypothetical protein
MPISALKNTIGHTAPDNITVPEAAPVYDFYKVKLNNEGDVKDVSIQQPGFLELLKDLGFRRYDIGDQFEVVRIKDNIIERMPIHRLREVIVRHFHALPDDLPMCDKAMLVEKLHRSLGTLTSEDKLSLLVDLEQELNDLDIVEDTKDTAYYFYQNGFVTVTADGVKLKEYKYLPGFVWKDQILPRDFRKTSFQDFSQGCYYKFACNIAGNPLKDGKDTNLERFVSFVSITGYNLHRFFNTKLRSTILLDSRMTEDPDGRSGKSLHCKALSHILNADVQNGRQSITIDGKRYDDKNRFNLDQLDVTTRLVIFDDIKRGFTIEDFFNAIVDGLVRERKGDMNKVKIFAKIIFTLNYTLSIRGGSAKDRVIEFEIADHYSNSYTPEMEFGNWFFRDWNKVEWNRFDNFMMWCVSEYLKGGLIFAGSVNLNARKLRDETSKEFIDFMEDLLVQHQQEYSKKDLYAKFVDLDSEGRIRRKDFHFLKQRGFTTWLRLWATYRPDIAGYLEYRSSGVDYIRYMYNMPVEAQYKEALTLFPDKSDRVTFITI